MRRLTGSIDAKPTQKAVDRAAHDRPPYWSARFHPRFASGHDGNSTSILMLILTRKAGESIVIDGHIIVKIVKIDRESVKVGIEAPANLSIHRQEIHEAIQRGIRRPLPAIQRRSPDESSVSDPTCPAK